MSESRRVGCAALGLLGPIRIKNGYFDFGLYEQGLVGWLVEAAMLYISYPITRQADSSNSL